MTVERIPARDNDDSDAERRDKYYAEIEDERRQHHLDRFAQLDRKNRTGPNHG